MQHEMNQLIVWWIGKFESVMNFSEESRCKIMFCRIGCYGRGATKRVFELFDKSSVFSLCGIFAKPLWKFWVS
jgi:hypothetical protein